MFSLSKCRFPQSRKAAKKTRRSEACRVRRERIWPRHKRTNRRRLELVIDDNNLPGILGFLCAGAFQADDALTSLCRHVARAHTSRVVHLARNVVLLPTLFCCWVRLRLVRAFRG